MSFSSFAEPVLASNFGVILFILLLFTFLILLRLSFGSGNRNADKYGGRIPLVSHFPVKLPIVVNGLYTLYKYQRDGQKLYERLQIKYGNIFEIPVANQTAIAVFEPDIIQKLLSSTNPQHLDKPYQIYSLLFPDTLKDGLIGSEYDVWSAHRKLLSRCFTYKSLQTYLPYMNEHGRSLVDQLKLQCSTDPDKSVREKQIDDAIWLGTFKIIIQTMVGENMVEAEDQLKFQHVFKRGKEIMRHRFLHPYLLLKFFWNMHPMKKELDDMLDVGIAFEKKMIAKCTEKLAKEQVKGTGIESSKNDDDGKDIGIKPFRSIVEELLLSGVSHKEILDEVATFASAGHETAHNAISMVLFHLACNPDCQKRCQEEVDQLLNSVGEESKEMYDLTMDDLTNLKYLERCILESLRLTTTIPFFLRQLSGPLEVDENLTLESGRIILFCPWVVQRDPNTYPNPKKFDPDRFLPENLKGRHPFSFIPFSSGSRNCIGYKFALLEMKIILALLLRQFNVFTKDDPDSINYSMEITLLPDKDIDLLLKCRK